MIEILGISFIFFTLLVIEKLFHENIIEHFDMEDLDSSRFMHFMGYLILVLASVLLVMIWQALVIIAVVAIAAFFINILATNVVAKIRLLLETVRK